MNTSISKYLAGLALIFAVATTVSAAAPGASAARGRGGAGRGIAPGATQRGPASTQRTAEDASEVAALKPAFDLLLGADHDYDGHRAKAMVAIARACELMGTDIVPSGLKEKLENAGDGARGRGPTTAATRPATKPTTKPAGPREHGDKEPEAQTTSDQQLKQAQTIVQQVLAGIPSGTQPRIAALLTKANEELTTALGIK